MNISGTVLGVVLLILTIFLLHKINHTDFDELQRKHPNWQIKAFLYLFLILPVLIEVLKYFNCDDLALLIDHYKDYIATVFSLMFASITLISEKNKANSSKK